MNRSKNICLFNTTSFWGGGEKWHYETAEYLSQSNVNTFFVCNINGELSKKLKILDVILFHITTSNLSLLNPFQFYKIYKFFLINKIDTVIFNNPKDLKLGGLAAKKAGVKNIVYRRGIAVEVSKIFLNNYIFRNIVSHFVFNSVATKSLLTKNFDNILSNKKSAIIYNAIKFPIYDIEATLSKSKKRIIIGNAGRLVKQKAQHFLLDIADILKKKNIDFTIKIAGEGPLYNNLKNDINSRDLTDYVQLIGHIDDMSNFMNGIDLFVSTALWEGFGFVLAEAMVAKKPILGFNISSNPELIHDGVNGFLIPPKDVTVFSEKIEILLNNSKLRNEFGLSAYQFAKSNFDSEMQFKKLIEFIS